MSPIYDQLAPAEEESGPSAPDERRRQVLRRRVTALVGLVVVLVGIASLSAGAGTRSHKRVSQSAQGLSPAQQQAAREARALDRVMTYTPYVSQGGTRRREIALTFDDGPGPYTPKVLALLRKEGVPATFFVVGQELRYFAAALPNELSDGIVIGNHTQNHPLMARLPGRQQLGELLMQARGIGKAGVPFPRLFRPPYGSFDSTTLELAHRLGMLTVLWSVDTQDYRQPGVQAIVQRVLGGARPGAIVLMHDAGGTRTQTVAALPYIVRGLRRRHFDLVTVPRLILDDPPPRSQQTPHNLGGG